MSNKKHKVTSKHYGVCKKCGKWYASFIGSMGHYHGQCDKIRDARDFYDFSDVNINKGS